MCLIAWNWQPHTDTPLLLVANRDEFYARPTLAMHAWSDVPIYAGKDLQGGGTWLGVGADGRLAALTNVRDFRNQRATAPSRGALVSGFLNGSARAADYLAGIAHQAADFNPFNLLVYDGHSMLGFESQGGRIVGFEPGISAVSNAGFDTPWPKLVALKAGLKALSHEIAPSKLLDTPQGEALFALLAQDQPAPDALLPDTGIPLERERALSSAFIRSADYGTRASSLILLRRNSAEFIERSFDARGLTGQTQIQL